MSDDHADGPRGVTGWAALALLTLSSAMLGLLELMFLGQFYAGSVIVPVTVLAAVAGNVLLPRWGMAMVAGVRGGVLPFGAWLLVALVPALYTRPEGDLFVLGAYGQDYAYYGLLLAGAIAGFSTLVVATGRPPR